MISKKYLIFILSTLICGNTFAANQAYVNIEKDKAIGAPLINSINAADYQNTQALTSVRTKRECSNFIIRNRQSPGKKTHSENQLVALRQLEKSCSGFTFFDSASAANKQFIKAAAISADPQYTALNNFLSLHASQSGFTREKRLEALNAIFVLKDPEIIDEIGIKLFKYSDGGSSPYVWFKGQKYTIKENPEILYSLALIGCRMGSNCNQNNYLVLTACAFHNRCHKNKDELVSAQARRRNKNAAKVIDLADQMAHEIKALNASAFVQNF